MLCVGLCALCAQCRKIITVSVSLRLREHSLATATLERCSTRESSFCDMSRLGVAGVRRAAAGPLQPRQATSWCRSQLARNKTAGTRSSVAGGAKMRLLDVMAAMRRAMAASEPSGCRRVATPQQVDAVRLSGGVGGWSSGTPTKNKRATVEC